MSSTMSSAAASMSHESNRSRPPASLVAAVAAPPPAPVTMSTQAIESWSASKKHSLPISRAQLRWKGKQQGTIAAHLVHGLREIHLVEAATAEDAFWQLVPALTLDDEREVHR